MERSYADSIMLAHVLAQSRFRWLAPPPPPSLSGYEALLHYWRREGSAHYDAFARCLNDVEGAALLVAARAHVAAVEAAGGSLLTLGDEAYPEDLAAIPDPPLVLTLLGDASLLRKTQRSAVVGSRKASAHALHESFALGRLLADAGHVVVSGGALGCDIAAHAGVLATRHDPAPAIIVLAGGLVRFYPEANRRYFDALRQRGALFVSERLWCAEARPHDFPARNRIICGLSKTTYVMQAARASGAMITARQALDQGRDLAVLTHPPGDIRAAGGAALLADGARAFTNAGGVLDKHSGNDYSYCHSTHDDA